MDSLAYMIGQLKVILRYLIVRFQGHGACAYWRVLPSSPWDGNAADTTSEPCQRRMLGGIP